MIDRIQAVPAVFLKRSEILSYLDDRLRKGGLEALLADPIPDAIVLPLDGCASAIDYTNEEFVVELSTRGTTPLTFFLHLIVESRYSGISVISFSQNQIGGLGGGRNPRIGLYEDWVRWSISFSTSNVSYRFAKHASLNQVFGESRYIGLDYRRVQAIVLGSWDAEFVSYLVISEVRLWKGRCLPQVEEQLEFLGGCRLDGREAQLLGYWKLDEGQGTRIVDSSRFGNHGILNGGQWMDASKSGLQLDRSFEIVRQQQDELRQQSEHIYALKSEINSLQQQAERLKRSIQNIQEERDTIEQQRTTIEANATRDIQALKDGYALWKKGIDDGRKVGLDHFSESIAKAIQEASEQLTAKKQPYELQSVGLELKMLPVKNKGEADFKVIFPQPDVDSVQPGQLSTLAISFEPRLQEPEKKMAVVPDVRGCTDVLARRILSATGFRVEMLDRAVDKEEFFDRVIDQIPEPDPEKPYELNGTVTLLLGRASRRV